MSRKGAPRNCSLPTRFKRRRGRPVVTRDGAIVLSYSLDRFSSDSFLRAPQALEAKSPYNETSQLMRQQTRFSSMMDPYHSEFGGAVIRCAMPTGLLTDKDPYSCTFERSGMGARERSTDEDDQPVDEVVVEGAQRRFGPTVARVLTGKSQHPEVEKLGLAALQRYQAATTSQTDLLSTPRWNPEPAPVEMDTDADLQQGAAMLLSMHEGQEPQASVLMLVQARCQACACN